MFSKKVPAKKWIVLLVLGIAFLSGCFAPPGEEKPALPLNVLDEPAFETDAVLTSVDFYPNELYFTDEDNNSHVIFLRKKLAVNPDAYYPFDGTEYVFTINKEEKRIYVTFFDDAFEPQTYYVPYTNKTISDAPLKLKPYWGRQEISYHYFVDEDVNMLELFMAKQTIALQFGKKVRFEGTDKDEDGTVDVQYYLEDWEVFGYDPFDEQHLVAHFLFDESGAGDYGIKVFLDTYEDALIEPSDEISYYEGPVFFDGTFFSEIGKTAVDSYGSQLRLLTGRLTVFMPVG